jgi:transcriptional regulator with XRE-family HTH domain
MKRYRDGPHSQEAIARRLRATRLALAADNQQEFGNRAGISQSNYSQYENGHKRPSVDASIALCETYALTLDWIYRGDLTGLPYKLAAAIQAQTES